MNKKEVLLLCGFVAGVVGTAVTVAVIVKNHKKAMRENLEKHLSFSFDIPEHVDVAKIMPRAKKSSSLVQQKNDKAHALLKIMKAGKSYTQVELQELSSIPYRSVRRYIDALVKDQKITAVGYGKGRKFSK